MKTIYINNKTVKLYDSIDELPILNFQKYNKCLLIDAGIGSDADSIDAHIVNIAKYIQKNDKSKALQELQNMRQNLYMVVSSVSPKYMAFAALVHSIDGKEQRDLSDSHLQEMLNSFNEVPNASILNVLYELKKKLSTELELYFPSEFDNAKEKEVYARLKMRAIFQLEEIIDDNVNNTAKIAEIDDFIFSLHKPKNFLGKDSEEIKYDKQFESACMVISQKTGMNAKNMSVLEFYNTLSNIQKQLELEKKAYNKPNRKR